MRVIEGRQIATDTHREAIVKMPETVSVTRGPVHVKEIQTVSRVIHPTEVQVAKAVTHPVEIQTSKDITQPMTVQVTKAVTQPIEILTTKTITHPIEVKVTRAVAHPTEVKSITGESGKPQKVRMAHPEILPDHKPVPLHTQTANVRDLQSMTRQLHPKMGTQNIQSVSMKPHVPEIRNGQREMTLEELFTTGRKEERS